MTDKIRIPVSTAVALRGDFWTLALDTHDARGHHTTRQDRQDYWSDIRASSLYQSARARGRSPSEAAMIVDLLAQNSL